MNRLTGKRAHNDDHARRSADTSQKTRSDCSEAAFDRVCGAYRIAGIIGQQIGHKARNIFRRAVPTESNRLRKRLFATGEYLFGEFEGHASCDGARAAGIDPNSTRSLLQRGRLGQHATEHSQLSLRPGSGGRAADKLMPRSCRGRIHRAWPKRLRQQMLIGTSGPAGPPPAGPSA
jgi:hypothetical protein